MQPHPEENLRVALNSAFCHEALIRAINRYRRYDERTSFALLEMNADGVYRGIRRRIRPTDAVEELDAGLFWITYGYTSVREAASAVRNLAGFLRGELSGVRIVGAFTQVYDEDHLPEQVIERLHDVLLEAREIDGPLALKGDSDFMRGYRRFHLGEPIGNM